MLLTKQQTWIKSTLFAFFFISSYIATVYASRDLSTFAQDFILETKKIDIPGYPDAFNPCIMRWHDKLLMYFRIRDPQANTTNKFGITWLDDEFNPIGLPQVLEREIFNPSSPEMAQDPKIFTVSDELYLAYNNMEVLHTGKNRRMLIARLHYDGVRFWTENTDCILEFEDNNPKRQEKNWVPIDFQGTLHLGYSIQPHKIMEPLPGTTKAITIATTTSPFQWPWGELRGGTPALLEGNAYLAFFHSVKDLSTTQSNGKHIIHYFMGAYTFSATPPFEITGVSPTPFYHEDFYTGPNYPTWTPMLAIFPGGFVSDDSYIWMSLGRQDHECWIVKLDKAKLLNSLIPVSSQKPPKY